MTRTMRTLLLGASALAGSATCAAAAPLVTSAVDDGVTTTVIGDRSPLLASAQDLGAVAGALPLAGVRVELKRPPEMQAAFDKLVHDQTVRGSASFHQWLTPAQLRAYGPSQADVDKVTAWLQSHQLTVDSVSPSGMSIAVSGTASAFGAAFHTSLHNVTLANGETHIANMTDAAIPSALAPVLRGATLSNFFPKPGAVKRAPGYTFATPFGTEYAVTPADFATIYNLNPLLDGTNAYGFKIAGAGVTIAVVERTKILPADYRSFRTQFGLDGYAGKLTFDYPGDCVAPGRTADEAEAAIDTEWASAVAPDAGMIEASCADGQVTFGVETALQGLVESGTKASVLSISYLSPEYDAGLTFLAGWTNLVEEGASEGLSIFLSSGDSGSSNSESVTTAGFGVSGLSTNAYNTTVGGTDFYDSALGENSTYWTKGNAGTYSSAKSYIPEIPWDNSCASSVIVQYLGFKDAINSCNSQLHVKQKLAFEQQGIGGSGGRSIIYEKPDWQSAPGVPNDGVRDQPDVSMFAANGSWNHFYLICMSDAAQGGSPCDYQNVQDAFGNAYGGTSVAAPAFAGAVALLVQLNGGKRQGNTAPRLYEIATAQFQQPYLLKHCNATLGNKIDAACVFNNVTTGNIAEPCVKGTPDCVSKADAPNNFGVLETPQGVETFPAHPGYSLATGLGSVNIANLLYNY